MLRHSTVWLLFVALSFAALGCGGGSWAYHVVGTQRDPGAEGTIQVERIEGGNRLVTVTLRHMTPPDRLAPGLTTFIMWFRDPHGRSTKASRLEYDPGSRTARATATTPLTRFALIVTAERDGNAIEPSQNVIFNQRVTTE
ncbi:MAG TPA: hypothetical protein VIL20_10025 [Sandaracinaceae bacterium]